jgi:hypothetical protein
MPDAACPSPNPVSAEIERQGRPWARRRAILEASTATGGLPSCLPRLLAPPFLTCAPDAIPFRTYAVAESTSIHGHKGAQPFSPAKPDWSWETSFAPSGASQPILDGKPTIHSESDRDAIDHVRIIGRMGISQQWANDQIMSLSS